MKNKNLSSERAEILAIARTWFKKIMDIPTDVRADTMHRSGLQVVVRNLNTRDLINFSVGEPSDKTIFYAIKGAIRFKSRKRIDSTAKAESKSNRYSGTITFRFNGEEIQVSVYGLKPEENTLISIMILSYIFRYPPVVISTDLVKENSILQRVLYDEDHYLFPLFDSEEIVDVIN